MMVMMMMMKREKKFKNGFGLDGSCIRERDLSVKCWGLFSICGGWDLIRPWKGCLETTCGL